jgi:hypothetical protein
MPVTAPPRPPRPGDPVDRDRLEGLAVKEPRLSGPFMRWAVLGSNQ